MRIIPIIAGITVAGLVCGCASNPMTHGLVQPDTPSPTETFTLKSVPTGAAVYMQSDTNRDPELIGQTPLVFSMSIRRKRAEGPFGLFKPRVVRTTVQPDRSLTVFAEQDHVRVALAPIELRADGYAPQRVSHEWILRSDSWWWPAGKEKQDAFKHTVFMQQPVEAQSWITLAFTSPLPDTAVYELNAEGGKGSLIGNTPFTLKVGFATLRSEQGETTTWRRWDEGVQGSNLWAHTHAGELLLSAMFTPEGFEPVRFVRQPVAQAKLDGHQDVRIQIPVLRPAKPQAEFLLSLDSLPSEATVYASRTDGILGRKLGETPLQLPVGIGEVLALNPQGRYVHSDWLIWAPTDIFSWHSSQDGYLELGFTAALHKAEFGLERVQSRLMRLHPGSAIPKGTDITVPLLSQEERATRDARKGNDPRGQAAQPSPLVSQSPSRAGFVWQPPEHNAQAPAVEPRILSEETENQGKRIWWWPWKRK